MHMRVQMMKMEGKLRAMDLIIEVIFKIIWKFLYLLFYYTRDHKISIF